MVKREKKLSNKPKKRSKFADEEILSDEASGSEGLSDDFFETTETAEEKRIRLAKQLILNLESSNQDKSEVSRILSNTGLEAKGKLLLKVADTVSPPYYPTFHKGHLLGVTCLALYPNGSRCVTGSKDCCMIVWDVETGGKLKILKGFRHKRDPKGHSDEILALAVSDDCNFLASGGKDRIIQIWDPNTLDWICSLKGHKDSITGLKFAHNSHTLYSCSLDRTVKVWEVSDKVILDTLHGHYTGVHDIDCYHNDKALTCGFDCSVRMWKTSEETQLVYNGHNESIDCIRIVNIEIFITGGQDGHLCIWKTGKKKPVGQLSSPHNGSWISSLAVLKNTDLLASGSNNGFINLYKILSNSLLKLSEIPVTGYITALEFSKSGKFLIACISPDHKLGRWNSSQKVKPGLTIIPLHLTIPS